MSSEKFCLRWNDFESNVSSAFKDIRDEKEFFDITIAFDDEQLQAHKVILSACSPFFRNVLRRNQHQHPLFYLKGVSYRDMEAVLNFMYHGEVNVAQDDLNSFLQVAEDLRVKGLTQNSSGSSANQTRRSVEVPKPDPKNDAFRNHVRTQDTVSAMKNASQSHPNPKILPKPPVQQEEVDIEEIIPAVKSEPRDNTTPATTEPIVQHEQGMDMYNERTHQIGGSMMMTMDAEQYEDSYGGAYDEHYGDQSYGSEVGAGQDTRAQGEAKSKCEHCDGWFHKRSMARHIERKHSIPMSVSCDMCGKVFLSNVNLKEHHRRDHGLSTRAKY